MKYKYKVTIAIPVYNAADSIKMTMMSALNQTFKSIEFLIIDDKGQDDSIDQIKEIIKTHPRGKDVRIIDHGINRGIGATKNTAIDNALGEFLYFLDSDDYITPNCIEKLYHYGKNVDCCYGSYITCDKNLFVTDYHNVKYSYSRTALPTLAHRIFNQWGLLYIQTWNKLYRMSFLLENNIRCAQNTNVDDVFFTFQIQYHCKSYMSLPDVTYYYLLHKDSTTSGMGGLKYDYALHLINAYDDIQNFIESHEKDEFAWGYEQTLYYHDKWFISKVLESQVMSNDQKYELLKNRFDSLELIKSESPYNRDRLNEMFLIPDLFKRAEKFSETHPFTPIVKAQSDEFFFRMKKILYTAIHLPKKFKIGQQVKVPLYTK